VLAKTRVESASAAGLNFSAPDLTAELHAADDAVTGTTQIDTHVVALSAGGAALGTTGDGYTASAPVVTSVVRPSAPVGGGVSVTVGGRFFSGAVAVDFQDRFGIVSARVSVVSDSKLVFTTPDLTPLVPPGTSGPFTVDVYVRVNVTNSLGGSIIYSNGSPFTVQPIAITAVSPFAGPVVGKTPIIVSGTGLSDVTELEFIATSAAARAAAPASFVVPVKSAGASTITVNTPDDTALAATPAGRVEFDIVAVAKTPSGTVESARTPADRFSYKAPMIATLSSGSPAISAAGGTSIVISGEYFQGVTEVVFEANGHDTEVAVSGSPKSIVVTSPDLSHELGGKPTMSVTVRLEVPVTGTHTGYYVRSSNMSTITMKA
jgi:hypothetical protein